MTPREVLERHAEAWNGHDPEGVAAPTGREMRPPGADFLASDPEGIA